LRSNLPGHQTSIFSPGAQTLEQNVPAGELERLLSALYPKLFLEGSPTIARLFANYNGVEGDLLTVAPGLHTCAAARGRLSSAPVAARSIYRAVRDKRAKPRGRRLLYDTDALRVALPWADRPCRGGAARIRRDFWAKRLEPNRPALGRSARYVHEQASRRAS
jgi:4,5-dihydroxyphthalate decarboxylase